MKGYANLGTSAGELLGAFLNDDVYRQKGYDDTIGKVQQARYYDARTQNELLDAEQKRRSRAITPEIIAQSFFGIDPGTFSRIQNGDVDQYGEAGPEIPVNPATIDQARRAAGVHTAFTMGDGNVEQILGALLKGQQMNAQDLVLGGQYEASDVGRAVAAAGGKALYNDGSSGVLDIFTGGVTPTDVSRSVVRENDAQAYAANQLGDARKIVKEAGGKDPARVAMQKFLESKGIPSDQALLLSMMDATPQEMHQQVYRTALSATTGSNDSSRRMADEYMEYMFGPNWKKMVSAGGGAPASTPSEDDPLGIRE